MANAKQSMKEIHIEMSDIAINVGKDKKGQDTLRTETAPTEVKADKINVRVKSTKREVLIGLIISLSALMFGYSLKEITSIPIADIIREYDITISKFAAQSILIGILPLGAILGVVVTKFLITRYRRLTGIYIFAVVNIGAMVLVNITTFGTLIAGRFIEGICVGYYTTIAPIYLKEIAPKELRRMLGLFFSFGKIIGVLFVIILELIFDAAPFDISWRIILSMTGVFSALQAILIFFFGSDTPAQMIEKGKETEAMKIIQRYIKQEFVTEVFDEYKKQYQMQKAKGRQTQSQDLNPPNRRRHINDTKSSELDLNFTQAQNPIKSQPDISYLFRYKNFKDQINQKEQQKSKAEKEESKNEMTFEDKKNSAYRLGLHICVIRHWTGGNAIITQGGLFINGLNPELGHYTSILINSIQFIFIVIGLVFIQKIAGKRPLFLISITVLSILDIALAVAMIHYQTMACEFIMCIYMAVYGGSFISPIWSYPSEIVPASQALGPNIVHWLALAISTLVPPVITGVMPRNNAYPVFIFFGLYGLLSLIHVFTKLRESDGKSYNQIIKSFK